MPGTAGFLPFCSKFVYAAAVDLLFPYPAVWQPPQELTVGGRSLSGAAVPEHYIRRREHAVALRTRWPESDHDAVLDWLEWYEDNAAPFDWFPDQNAPQSFSCYLDKPVVGGAFDPKFDQRSLYYEYEFRLRRAGGLRFTGLIRHPNA